MLVQCGLGKSREEKSDCEWESSSQAHVRDSVAQIDANTWLIGTQNIIQKLQHDETPCENRPNQRCMWRNDSDGAYYMLYPAPFRLPKVSPLPAASSDSHVRQIHDAGDVSAVFKFGHSLILKVKIRSTFKQKGDSTAVLTQPYEHETLAFLSEQQLSFKVPRVLFHVQEGNKTFLLEPCMPGQTVNEAWWTMTPAEKDGVTTRVAAIVNELTAFRADTSPPGPPTTTGSTPGAKTRTRSARWARLKNIARPWVWIAPYMSYLTTTSGRRTL